MNVVKYRDFNFVEVNKDFWISGVEICRNLGYSTPRGQAGKIWKRHSKTLDPYSTVVKLATVDDKNRETRCYNEIGARMFITKCHVPLADQITLEMIKGFITLRDRFINLKLRQAKLEWQTARAEGKLIRHEETDVIKEYIAYAMSQGSKNADWYYVSITKMEYKALFFIEANIPKPNNFKTLLSTMQLINLSSANNIVCKALREGIDNVEPYKDIFKNAKEKVEAFSELIGKTKVVPLLPVWQ